MATYEYDDFRVKFTPHSDGAAYELEAASPGGAAARATFTQPLSDDDLRRAVQTLGRTRSSTTRDIGAAVIERRVTAEQLGATLAGALFTGEIGTAYEAARAKAASAGRGLRLRLSLADAPALLNVPWEFMYVKPTFLASQRRTPIVRFLETDSPVTPGHVEGNVRILGLIANPEGSQVLKVEDERAKVDTALAKARQERGVDVDWLDPATPRRLRQTLQEGNYHILHFVGHSEYRDGEGVLFLENDEGKMAQVSTSQFVNLLGDQTTLRLVVLNSCDAARTDAVDPFAGLATSIVALGIPAVVAMQFEISDQAAITFAEELYHSLIARQDPIDAAVAEARKAVFTEVSEIEWATPVLFLRNDDGRLFTFAEPGAEAFAPPPPPPPPLPPPPKRRGWAHTSKGKVVAASTIGLLAIGALVVGGLALGGDDSANVVTATQAPVSTAAPDTTGAAASSGEFVNPVKVAVPVQAGDTGSDVQNVQFFMVRVGLPIGSLGVDGAFGPITENAVRSFQSTRGLEVTGVVDAATAGQMSEWVGPRQKSNAIAVSAVNTTDGATNIFFVDPVTGVVGLGTTKKARDVEPAWNAVSNQVAFSRISADGKQTVEVIVPSSGDDPRGGFDAGISVKRAVNIGGRLPVWGGTAGLTVVTERPGCAPNPSCHDIVVFVVTPNADLITAPGDDPLPVSEGWGDITGLDDDPLAVSRFAVVGTGPDGSGRTGLWFVSAGVAPTFVAGTEEAVDVAFARDGSSLGVIGLAGSRPGWGTAVTITTTDGAPTATATVDVLINRAQAGRPDLTLPAAADAEIGALTAAPDGTGATFAVLLRSTVAGAGLPLILLFDNDLGFVQAVVPVASELDNDTNYLNPDKWRDIVDLAG